MSAPKVRMVAGPNGSGKSTLIEFLRSRYSFPMGYCQNPDEIEKQIMLKRAFDFADWGLNVQPAALRRFLKSHPLSDKAWVRRIAVEKNILNVEQNLPMGYFTAALCDFMRRQWLAARETFTFETVMSNPDKIRLLRRAQRQGSRTYLYFICTDSVAINFERVAVRVADGGHGLSREKIEQRYVRSLALLAPAIKAANRAYLFDNSGQSHRLVGEFENGRLMAAANDLPAWFIKNI